MLCPLTFSCTTNRRDGSVAIDEVGLDQDAASTSTAVAAGAAVDGDVPVVDEGAAHLQVHLAATPTPARGVGLAARPVRSVEGAVVTAGAGPARSGTALPSVASSSTRCGARRARHRTDRDVDGVRALSVGGSAGQDSFQLKVEVGAGEVDVVCSESGGKLETDLPDDHLRAGVGVVVHGASWVQLQRSEGHLGLGAHVSRLERDDLRVLAYPSVTAGANDHVNHAAKNPIQIKSRGSQAQNGDRFGQDELPSVVQLQVDVQLGVGQVAIAIPLQRPFVVGLHADESGAVAVDLADVERLLTVVGAQLKLGVVLQGHGVKGKVIAALVDRQIEHLLS